jgi:hypothetical protein
LVWIEIELVDEENQPVPRERYQIELTDGSVAKGTLDFQGRARHEGIPRGNCKVSFPDRDAKDWKKA